MRRHHLDIPSVVLVIIVSSALVGAAAPVGASTVVDLDLPLAAGTSVEAAEAMAMAPRPDFNGDERADLAIGVPGENLGADNQGAVNVIYGSPAGLTATDNQLWSQDVPGVLGTGEANDRFGDAIGWADFNGDGFDDMAAGAPGDVVSGKDDAGGVNVIYGSAAGLTTTGNQLWTQDSADVPGNPRTFDFFGNSLLGRDFDQDGFDDLVIGAFGDGKDGFPADSGSALVLYGSASGLRSNGNQDLHQLKGKAQKFDWFGHTLGSGDFNDDGHPDLAIGAPFETHSGLRTAGAVNVMYGSASGVKSAGNQFWHQEAPGVVGDASPGENLGWSLSVGDFDGDAIADLAMGIQYDEVGAVSGAGSALVLYGSSGGLSATGNQLWNQDSSGVLDVAEPNDGNSAVLAGDFDADGFADLAIGFQDEDLDATQNAGAVNVVYGSAAGLAAAGNQFWHQNAGIFEIAETDDWFGAALTRGDYDGDGFPDLVIGVPAESVATGILGGAVNVVYGSSGGLSSTGNQLWSQHSDGILDNGENPDFFGESLAER